MTTMEQLQALIGVCRYILLGGLLAYYLYWPVEGSA